MIVEIIVGVVAIEAIVEILVSSDLFISVRTIVTKVNPSFLGKLFGCGYCMSVWIAAVAACFLQVDFTNHPYVDLCLRWLLFHRSSNIFHEILSRYFKRLPFQMVFNHVKDPGFPIDQKTYEVPDQEVKVGSSEV